jgi:PRC-barrel domain
MLIKAKALKGFKLKGRDGEIGKVEEFYFDDTHWAIRYLVADTGNWLTGREVLISPYALGDVDTEKKDIAINLTRKQIEGSPSLETDRPVSRQFEEDYYGYYGWPMYWSGPNMWGAYPYIERAREARKTHNEGGKPWDAHLRSTRSVNAYEIEAADGELGHVGDFVIDDLTWAIRYLIIDTRNWWPGKKVLISPKWIERISWKESKVFVDLQREAIKKSPEYSEEMLLTRDYETRLHKHYDRTEYWVDEPAAKVHSR